MRVSRRAALALSALLALSACGTSDTGGDQATAGDGEPIGVGNSLDTLARDAGVLPDAGGASPVGRYARRSGGETDRLCLLPVGDDGSRFRFGAETRIGADEFCRGRGTVRRDGSRLVFTFEGRAEGCVMTADYEGDRIVMPGSVDARCARLCNHRGSLAGVAFPRVDGDVARARVMADKDGQPLCG